MCMLCLLQGLVGAIFEGIGVSAGSFIGGYMMEHMGGSYTFRMFGIAALLLCILHVLVQKFIAKCACISGKTVYGGRASGGEVNNTPQNEHTDGGLVITEVYRPLPQDLNGKN